LDWRRLTNKKIDGPIESFFDTFFHASLGRLLNRLEVHNEVVVEPLFVVLLPLAENAVGPARRGRLARARAAVKKHPDYSESGYFLAVETAFKNWEAMQNIGR
jgi:hypothetical protein